MKTSELLIKAKKRLGRRDFDEHNPSKKPRFVCHAIHRAAEATNTEEAWRTKTKLVERIRVALGSQSFVDMWLRFNHTELYRELRRTKRIQAYRHAWVDSLIAEYQAAGD